MSERDVQCLGVSAKARETDEDLIVDFVDSLEISGDCLKVDSKSAIASYSEAVLSHHSNYGTSIVLEDLPTKQN